jgi:hypothetical protein
MTVVLVVASVGLAMPAVAKTKHHKTSIATAWCSLKIGQPATRARAKLGKLSKLAPAIKAILADVDGITALEWNKDGDVFLVTFGGDGIAKLQAYSSLKTFAPATNLSCPAFRVG